MHLATENHPMEFDVVFFPAEKPSFAPGIFQHATFNYHMVTVIVEINDKVDN